MLPPPEFRNFDLAEFRGYARLFRDRVMAADRAYQRETAALLAPIEARLRRKPTLRDDKITTFLNAWVRIDHPFRLDPRIDIPANGHVTVNDLVLTGTTNIEATWDEPELSIDLTLVRIDTRKRPVRTSRRIAAISFHALARWYQRTGRRTDEELFHDLTAIFFADKIQHWMRSPRGAWATHLKLMPTGHALSIRTFIAAESTSFLEVTA